MIRNRLFRSFTHAWRGLLLAFATERSFRIELVATLGVCVFLLLVPLRDWERVILLLATASVLVLELFNSMVERLVDLVKPRMHGYVHDIKDLMAATVLIASFFAVVIGVLIMWPHAAQLFRQI